MAKKRSKNSSSKDLFKKHPNLKVLLLILFLSVLALFFLKNKYSPSTYAPINLESPSNAILHRQPKIDPLYDSTIKWDFRLIDEALSCHFSYNGIYPATIESFDKRCFILGKGPNNPNTGKPYDYKVTSDGKKYTLRTELSTGEYILTESIHPTPLPQ